MGAPDFYEADSESVAAHNLVASNSIGGVLSQEQTAPSITESKPPVTMEKLVNLCRRRGLIFPSSDIYGGLG